MRTASSHSTISGTSWALPGWYQMIHIPVYTEDSMNPTVRNSCASISITMAAVLLTGLVAVSCATGEPAKAPPHHLSSSNEKW